jgi:small-conductance mechanosensitive channel
MRILLAALACASALIGARVSAAEPGAPTAAAKAVAGPSADVVVFNRTVATFRASVLGVTPQDRAARSQARLVDLLSRPGKHEVSIKATPLGQAIAVDGSAAFVIAPDDVDPLGDETIDDVARRSAAIVAQVSSETKESRDLHALGIGALAALIATAVFVLLVWAIRRARRAITTRLARLVTTQGSKLRVGAAEVLGRDRLAAFARWLVKIVSWIVIALLAYEWVGFVLGRFPYTRPWGEGLVRFLSDLLGGVARAMIGALPGLMLAAVIFVVARFAVVISNSLFERVAQGGAKIKWLDADTVLPTRRIASAVIWLFALAMAYPYLPGAQTDAFKGLSVLVGLMISLGATSMVGQGAAGLILMYTRTLRAGEYVRIGEFEGTVVEFGLFVTRIRTGLGEELTISNAVVAGSVTKNYSRAVSGPGFVLDTVVTIGYDAPWRQVEAMLLEAARRTEGVVQDPPSRVHQTSLSDFYVEYRLVTYAVPQRPIPRALVLTALHANIQDVFNEHGVQIMSPHYIADPDSPKVIPKAGWSPPPARPVGDESGSPA